MPAYSKKLLNEGEEIVLDLKPHWWYFIRHVMVGAGLGAIILIWAVADTPLESVVVWVWALALIAFTAWVVWSYLQWTYTHFVLTTRRVVSRRGVVSRHGHEIPLERVTNINFSQHIWERIIGAGDLNIEAAGRDAQSHFSNVRHPDMVQQAIYDQMETNAKRQAEWARPEMPAPEPATAVPVNDPDVAEQIRKLAELRDEGHITPVEFEAKKAELLQRM